MVSTQIQCIGMYIALITQLLNSPYRIDQGIIIFVGEKTGAQGAKRAAMRSVNCLTDSVEPS